MIGKKQKNAQAHQALYFNLYFIIDFGVVEEPTEPMPPRESRSQTIEIHIKCVLKKIIREYTRGRWV